MTMTNIHEMWSKYLNDKNGVVKVVEVSYFKQKHIFMAKRSSVNLKKAIFVIGYVDFSKY